MLNFQDINNAELRIAPHIKSTPLLTNAYLDNLLGANLYFKCEGLQTTGAFKLRGALNALLALKEAGNLPTHVVAISSGNHAQAVAYACQLLGCKATIFIQKSSSALKIAATRAYGAEVILTDNKAQSEEGVHKMRQTGAYFLHPFDNDDIILGQGTSCLEALRDVPAPNAIFAPIGGGGLISGTYIAAQLLSPSSLVIGAEPKLGNDASASFKAGKIITLAESPPTIADGARTQAVCPRTFEYIQQLHDIIETDEQSIIHWTRLLLLHLKVAIEPTSAVAMAACAQWLASQPSAANQSILIILSGGNVDSSTYRQIWSDN